MRLHYLCSVLHGLSSALAAVREVQWNITYVDNISPDGSGVARRVIGHVDHKQGRTTANLDRVNNEWPIPALSFNYGDNVVITANNQLPDQLTSLHAHGLFQNGTNWADGPQLVTQCGIPPGSSFTYNYTVEQNGTYWIHSHTMGQFPDGLRTPFIIHSPNETYAYDAEYTIYFSDWYHQPMTVLSSVFTSFTNPGGAEPIPDAALINDSQNVTFAVEPNKTYRLRFVNVAAFAAFHVWIEGHDMEIIEVDGVDTESMTVQGFVITTAQRYSVLVRTKSTTTTNFAIIGSMDEDMFDTVPAGLNNNVTGYLQYNADAELPIPTLVDNYPSSNDFDLVPVVEMGVVDADDSFNQDILFDNLNDGQNYAFFNGMTYKPPKTPTLFTTIIAGKNVNTSLVSDPTIYGDYTNTHILRHNEMIEMVLNNQDPGKHPFHLHGHTFQVLKRSEENEGDYNPANTSWTAPVNPMRRDTLQLPPMGHAIIRFRADNPGIWLFHCHIEWHVMVGLISTMVEAPELLAQQYIPQASYDLCAAQGISTIGNAAGNVDLINLAGQTKPVGPIPTGFTGRGIAAMSFSVLSAVMGLATIAWYGLHQLESDVSAAPEDDSVEVPYRD